MKRDLRALLTIAVLGIVNAAASAADPVEQLLAKLNQTAAVVGSVEIKSYPVIFDAYLDLDPPPIEITSEFNNRTIHPGMPRWDVVAGWAESNGAMAAALLACENKTLFGLPYGRANVEATYRDADLVADIGSSGSLRENTFPYLDAIETIVTFGTAESYRLLEAGRIEQGLDLAIASIFLMRQCCDREFLDEQLLAISLLIESLENLRDMMYTYLDQIDVDKLREHAIAKLPYLRPDRSRLLLPEGDRLVSEALLREVFDEDGQPDRDKFASTFASIQSADSPLTRFGAARRWRMIAEVHDSEAASLERLELVYDDWWRRWRVEEYDTILDIATHHERTNPIRYAAVIYSIKDIEKAFAVRNELIAHVNGTAMAFGLAAYHRHFGNYPATSDRSYAQMVRKRSDRDPFDVEFQPFKYRVLDERFAIDTPSGRVFLPAGECILYSLGQDHMDGRGSTHTDDGAAGDIVLWPPIRSILRKEGLVE